jgi:hypothetical protein
MEPFPTPPQTSAREGFRGGEAAVGAQGRLLRAGAQVLSDPELLSILCRAGRSEAATLRLAWELLDEHGGLAGLMVAGPECCPPAAISRTRGSPRHPRAGLPPRSGTDLRSGAPRIAAMGEGISPTPGGKDSTEWMPFSLPVESSFATNADTF